MHRRHSIERHRQRERESSKGVRVNVGLSRKDTRKRDVDDDWWKKGEGKSVVKCIVSEVHVTSLAK